MVGNRGAFAAFEFMKDLAGRLANRVRITPDGLAAYVPAIEATFGSDVDFAQLAPSAGPSSAFCCSAFRRASRSSISRTISEISQTAISHASKHF
ncbi:MAG TPA: hypothetical protein VMG40_20360 [Bryobacteraceae bacterium]|nr:hypothetical protein [Bryobacteraceae bacterium]